MFSEQAIPAVAEIVESYNLDDRLNYITDKKVRQRAREILDEIKEWDPKRIAIEPLKYDVSLKISGQVFAYFSPRRKYFLFATNDEEGKWTGYQIYSEEDLSPVMELMQKNMEIAASK